jgi:hypothetical protein
MKIARLIAAAALGLSAGAASAQSLDATTSILCLDVSGKILPANCRAPASRLDPHIDICTCPMGGNRVTVPVCPKGVEPPAESAAYEKARLAAVTKGSLVGAMYQGKPMCVTARNSRAGGD